ncbi:MAG: hypothetical protein KAH95_16370, partial [Spirochaetales bacterium]|nr:hypothetical protein [Spirochaetales bacterium]
MQKGRLSYYSAAVLGLLGVFFLLSLILSFYGIGNPSGDFLKASFTYASFFIPLYIFTAALMSFKEQFRSKWVILLTSTILPFLTLVLFLKVYLDIDSSLPVVFTVNLMGRKESSFLLSLIFLVEILIIYVLSIKISVATRASIEVNTQIIKEVPEVIEESNHKGHSILRPGISEELLGTSSVDSTDSFDSDQSDYNNPTPFMTENIS